MNAAPSSMPPPRTHPKSVMLESGLDIKPVITRRFHYADFEQGFTAMESGDCCKVALDWISC